MNELIFTAIVSAVTGIAGWFAARRQNLAEVRSTEIDNLEKAVKYYREIFEDMASRHKTTIEELDYVTKNMEDLKKQVQDLTMQIKMMEDTNATLLEELRKYKQLNGKRDDTKK